MSTKRSKGEEKKAAGAGAGIGKGALPGIISSCEGKKMAMPSEVPEVKADIDSKTVGGRPVIVVSQNGDGDYDSLREAFKAAKPGTTIQIREGMYEEDINITKPNLTIEGEPGVEIVSGNDGYTVRFSAESGTLRNLRLHNFSEHTGCSVLDITSGRLLVENCEVTGGSVGIGISGKAEPVLKGNKVHDSRIGIMAQKGGKGTAENNTVYGNNIAGISIKEGAELHVKGNRLLFNYRGVLIFSDGRGVVEDNDIIRSESAGITVRGGVTATISKNRVCFGDTGIDVYSTGGV